MITKNKHKRYGRKRAPNRMAINNCLSLMRAIDRKIYKERERERKRENNREIGI